LVEHFMDGLRKAGLDIPDEPGMPSAESMRLRSLKT